MPERTRGIIPKFIVLNLDDSHNLFFIEDKNNNKFLIDSGAGISICKPHIAPIQDLNLNENVVIHGISNQDILITKSFSYLPNPNAQCPHKIYVYDLEIP